MPYFGPWQPGRSVRVRVTFGPSDTSFVVLDGAVPAGPASARVLRVQTPRTYLRASGPVYYPFGDAPPESSGWADNTIYSSPPSPGVVAAAWDTARVGLYVSAGGVEQAGWQYESETNATYRHDDDGNVVDPGNGYLTFRSLLSMHDVPASEYSQQAFFYPVGYVAEPGVTLEWQDALPVFTAASADGFVPNDSAGGGPPLPTVRRYLRAAGGDAAFWPGVDSDGDPASIDANPGQVEAGPTGSTQIPVAWLNSSGGFSSLVVTAAQQSSATPGPLPVNGPAESVCLPAGFVYTLTFDSPPWRTVSDVAPEPANPTARTGLLPLRQVQRGDGLGVGGVPRAVQRRSRQASLRRGPSTLT